MTAELILLCNVGVLAVWILVTIRAFSSGSQEAKVIDRVGKMDEELTNELAKLIFDYMLSLDKGGYYISFEALKTSYDALVDEYRRTENERRKTQIIREMADSGFILPEEAERLSGLESAIFSWAYHNYKFVTKQIDFLHFVDTNSLPKTDTQRQVLSEAYRTAKEQQQLLTSTAAERMGVSVSTFTKWAKKAGVNPVGTYDGRYGTGYLWLAQDVDKVIQFRKDN